MHYSVGVYVHVSCTHALQCRCVCTCYLNAVSMCVYMCVHVRTCSSECVLVVCVRVRVCTYLGGVCMCVYACVTSECTCIVYLLGCTGWKELNGVTFVSGDTTREQDSILLSIIIEKSHQAFYLLNS